MSSEGANAATREQGALAPKLRFPEFRDAPDWQLSPLKNFAKRRTRRNVGAKIDRVLTNSAEHGIVDQRDYFEKDIANLGNLEGYFIVEKGDYVYNPRISNLAPVGPIHKNNVGLGVMSPLYTVFSFHGAKNDFYAHYFKTPDWHSYLRHVSNSGARHDRMAISANDFINMPVPVSDPLEQQKIADCLSSIDARIAAEADMLDALKDHKTGLTQQLFPAPGEITPRLRFPEFQGAGEWELKAISEIADLHKGKGISKLDISIDGNQPCIRYGELYTTYGEVIDETLSKTNLPLSELFMSKKNDVIIPSSGETKIDIATASCVMRDNIALGGDLNVIRSRQNGVFLSYFLNGPLKYEIAKVAQGDSVVHLYPTQIGLLRVAIPTTEEQQAIATCLSSIDTRIMAQSDKIDALEVHKRGLMQQLFPVAGEVQA